MSSMSLCRRMKRAMRFTILQRMTTMNSTEMKSMGNLNGSLGITQELATFLAYFEPDKEPAWKDNPSR